MNTDEGDRILDDALASYLPEPRAGLPGRVMARVQSKRASLRSRSWGLWVMAAAALASLAFLIRPRPTPVPTPQRIAIERPSVPAPQHSPELQREKRSGPSPLTREERLLVSLAQQAPDTAAWLAQRDRELAVQPIEIRPLQISELQPYLQTGEIK
jgi:hypothetical protein